MGGFITHGVFEMMLASSTDDCLFRYIEMIDISLPSLTLPECFAKATYHLCVTLFHPLNPSFAQIFVVQKRLEGT